MASPRVRRLQKLRRLQRAGLVEVPTAAVEAEQTNVAEDKPLLEEVDDVVETAEEAVEVVVEKAKSLGKKKTTKKPYSNRSSTKKS